MHDIQKIRATPEFFIEAFTRRGFNGVSVVENILYLDSNVRKYKTSLNSAQTELNRISKTIGVKRRNNENTADLESQVSTFKANIILAEEELEICQPKLSELLSTLPNILDIAVPNGRNEDDNVVIHTFNEDTALDYAKEHFDLGVELGMMDFDNAGKMAGSRFTILSGPLARLERAIGQYMIDYHVDNHGYLEKAVPLLVKEQTMYGTGQLPKFEEDLFKTIDGRYLIPTAEVSLTNIVANEIIAEDKLPLRFTALSECFRAEAGSAGKDTRGMLRQHQFRKVELVSIVLPEESQAEHERMTQCAEAILRTLCLPYRRILLCSGDTGFSSTKTYDLEVWLPRQKKWREISSVSNCLDFQARRMNARYKGIEGKVKGHVHTLNGSGVAVGRALIAVMENYQLRDGSIQVPMVLQRYCGMDKIRK